MRDLNVVAEQLFNEIRGRYPSVTIGDEEGNVTNEPRLARFYEFDFKSNDTNVGKVSISLDEKTGVTIMYNKDFTAEVGDAETKDWYNFLKQVRNFSKRRLLNFEVRDINKTNFTKRDYGYMAANRGETQMAESKMYGTHKTSFQKFGSAKLSIRHTGAIAEGESRNKKIGALFIENADGEKFKYPFKHLAGARAMAIHVSEGGHPFDDFGKHITSLSEELSNLRKFKQYMGKSNVMAESLAEHMDTVNERVATVKKEMQSLQKLAGYKTVFEEFVPIEESEVPEEVQEDWINQLTIKQFNEELKDVFPYIYKLVSETTAVENIGFDDIVNEVDKASIDAAVSKALSSEPQRTAPTTSPRPKVRPKVFASPRQARDAAMKAGYRQEGKDFTVEKFGNGYIFSQIGPDQSNIGSTEIGPDGKVTGSTRGFNTESEIDMAFDKLLGQFADNFSAQVEGKSEGDSYYIMTHAKKMAADDGLDPTNLSYGTLSDYIKKARKQRGLDEGSMKDMLIQAMEKIASDNSGEELYKALSKGSMGKDIQKYLQSMYDEIAVDNGWHPDDDHEEIEQRMWDEIHDEYGMGEGNAYAHAVRKAKMDGKKKGDKIDHPDPDEDDIVIEKDKTPLGEFILSYFDRQTGKFPKGETAVLTAIEKDYGDQYVKPASQFIERLGQVYEKYQARKMADFTRIQELAGLR